MEKLRLPAPPLRRDSHLCAVFLDGVEEHPAIALQLSLTDAIYPEKLNTGSRVILRHLFETPVMKDDERRYVLKISSDFSELAEPRKEEMPLARRPSTWSFMRAMRGETTTVSPEKASAGS